jgi:hypothetical protein
VELRTAWRVEELLGSDGGSFVVRGPAGELGASRVALATGGLSLPKSGSDGGGLELARRLGHSIVPTTPALAPLVLAGDFHRALSGVSCPVVLTVHDPGVKPRRIEGSLLFTHFGISGPAALDASRHLLRARLEGRAARLAASFLRGLDEAAADRALLDLAWRRPRLRLEGALAEHLPASLAGRVLEALGLDGATPLGRLPRESRRLLTRALVDWPLDVEGSRGYSFAEATAGGVALREVDPATLESRRQPGLYLVGEMLDVDGRLGGFNFQWAWSSGCVAGRALATRIAGASPR